MKLVEGMKSQGAFFKNGLAGRTDESGISQLEKLELLWLQKRKVGFRRSLKSDCKRI